MDKRTIIILADHGWSHAEIARRFNVSRARICQIVKWLRDSLGITRCEICKTPIKKKQYVEIEGTTPFLVCDKCKKELQER